MNFPLISTYLELCKRKWSVEENDDEKTALWRLTSIKLLLDKLVVIGAIGLGK